MMRLSLQKLIIPSCAFMIALLIIVPSVSAQCAMCRAALAGSNNAFFIRNFNIGVLVLLVPPVTMFCSIFVALKRYHREDLESAAREHDSAEEE